jgi:hypothetical protein
MDTSIQSHTGRGRGFRLTATLLVVAALVSVSAIPAHAAPPMISANPEELVFSIGATTPKVTTITWDVGDEEDAEVTISKNGDPSSSWMDEPTGTEDFLVDPGTATYLFCLQKDRDVFACVTVKSSVQSIVPNDEPDDTKPDIKIEADFIHGQADDPTGYTAKLTYTTDGPTIPVVLISKKHPLPFPLLSPDEPKVFESEDVEGFSFNVGDGKQTSHANKLINLDPGTTYHYVISAQNPDTGFWHTEKGTFKTLKRNVSVTFDQIKVLDDSDNLSAGEFAFTFFVNGGGPSGWPKTIYSTLNTGATKTVNLTGNVADAPATLGLKVVGYDDDETESPFSLDVCGANAADFSKSEGENDCGEWTTAKGSFDVGPNVDAPNPESFTKTFSVAAVPQGDDSEVSFKVTGSYSVSFS